MEQQVKKSQHFQKTRLSNAANVDHLMFGTGFGNPLVEDMRMSDIIVVAAIDDGGAKERTRKERIAF